jgi:N-acetyl sugar amidotransferase
MDGREVKYCNLCLMPNSRPRINFNSEGICNACINSTQKDSVDWELRGNEFNKILDKFRSSDGSWDCLVPWSGGKDSSAIAYKLKYEHGMNPLLVTFSPMLPNEVGNYNREALIRQGFDHIFFRPDQKVHRILARRFMIERGNPKVAWDAGINTIPIKISINFKIKLVFYAEHGESEYGGKVLNEESKRSRNFTEVIEHQIGDDPCNWVTDEVTMNDLNPYIYPSTEELENSEVKAYYYSYFHRWSMFENYKYVKEKYDFKENSRGRTCGTFTDFDSLDDKFDDIYYYMQYIKFGFGRCVRDTTRFIHNGYINRDEAIELCNKYDGEFPDYYFNDILDYLDLSKSEFIEIIDKHRNDEIWGRDENNNWKLRSPLPAIKSEKGINQNKIMERLL